MRTRLVASLVIALLATLTPATARGEVDFAKMERTIAKEPKYVAQPLYAMFLMDAEGRSRHWAVLDKSKPDLPYYDVLYFDTTGNGDLTESSKRFVGKYDKNLEPAGMGLTIRIGDVRVPGADLVHTNFLISTTSKSTWKGIWFRMNWADKTEVSGGYNRVGYDATKYATSPKTAPILWPCPHAKLSFGVWGDLPALTRGQAPRINFLVGNWGSGPDTLVVVDDQFLLFPLDRLFATVITRDGDGREFWTRTEIKGHC